MIQSNHKHQAVLISFDVEEFDLPREHGAEISLEEGVKVSSAGLERVLDLLARTNIKATFFITGNFATHRPDLVQKIVKYGHEVACHGVDHFDPKSTDPAISKQLVEKAAPQAIHGYRQPRMFKIGYSALATAGFEYDSSVNPAWIPGRYNNRNIPRRPFKKQGITELPVSVATGLRVPLFWLALHLFPAALYVKLAKTSLKETGYFATYFHPWEFSDELKGYGAVPAYIKKNSGLKLISRLEKVILALQKSGYEFQTYHEFLESQA